MKNHRGEAINLYINSAALELVRQDAQAQDISVSKLVSRILLAHYENRAMQLHNPIRPIV